VSFRFTNGDLGPGVWVPKVSFASDFRGGRPGSLAVKRGSQCVDRPDRFCGELLPLRGFEASARAANVKARSFDPRHGT
jgi:hypothetical protein